MNQKHSKTGAMQKETKTYDMKILMLKNMFKTSSKMNFLWKKYILHILE